jgi:hypothetical protein
MDMVVGAWYGRGLALAGAASALVPALFMWGFTVDDALISLRYAHHLASGAGYRFNLHGSPTDGVTPLPWAPLLALLAGGDDLVIGLERAKVLGVVAWTLAGAALGHALAHRARGERRATVHAGVALLVLALAFPIGAWAASGMETGLATALATFGAISFERPRRAALLAGLAASLRPELVVWAVILACGAALPRRQAPPGGSTESGAAAPAEGARRLAVAAALAGGPFVVCALVRLAAFGRAGPLALLAKPSDLQHGVVYAGAAFVVVLTPLLALAPVAVFRASALSRTLAVATLAHVVVVTAVGGDWMPYARLMVPVAPALALVFVDVGGSAPAGRLAHQASTAGRALVAATLGVLVAATAAPAGRRVHADRKDLIAQARPLLASAKVVAALDVGWVGAATKADIVDLAGVTDPSIAVLRGGHTSKAVDVAMLLERKVDTVVVYGQPRSVEERLLRSALFEARFERSATIVFGGDKHYAVYSRSNVE